MDALRGDTVCEADEVWAVGVRLRAKACGLHPAQGGGLIRARDDVSFRVATRFRGDCQAGGRCWEPGGICRCRDGFQDAGATACCRVVCHFRDAVRLSVGAMGWSAGDMMIHSLSWVGCSARGASFCRCGGCRAVGYVRSSLSGRLRCGVVRRLGMRLTAQPEPLWRLCGSNASYRCVLRM